MERTFNKIKLIFEVLNFSNYYLLGIAVTFFVISFQPEIEVNTIYAVTNATLFFTLSDLFKKVVSVYVNFSDDEQNKKDNLYYGLFNLMVVALNLYGIYLLIFNLICNIPIDLVSEYNNEINRLTLWIFALSLLNMWCNNYITVIKLIIEWIEFFKTELLLFINNQKDKNT